MLKSVACCIGEWLIPRGSKSRRGASVLWRTWATLAHVLALHDLAFTKKRRGHLDLLLRGFPPLLQRVVMYRDWQSKV
eukprot:4429621-Alexandrium_andersonii.AAC.1